MGSEFVDDGGQNLLMTATTASSTAAAPVPRLGAPPPGGDDPHAAGNRGGQGIEGLRLHMAEIGWVWVRQERCRVHVGGGVLSCQYQMKEFVLKRRRRILVGVPDTATVLMCQLLTLTDV